MALRFGILAGQDAALSTLVERWKRIEELGFDQLWLEDHIRNPFAPQGPWFDGWTALAAAASHTTSVRVGTLVSNPILRAPAVLANAAVAVDHVSGGRLEVGLGSGVWSMDHAATGTPYWEPSERASRFREYVAVIQGMLGSADRPFGYEGKHYRAHAEVRLHPGPIQTPHPPITVGGQSPTVLRVAAERAQRWNSHGRYGMSVDELFEHMRRQNLELDEMCAALGRDPASLARSMLLFEATDPWHAPVDPGDIVNRFVGAGISEFVLFWPPDDRIDALERFASDVIPALRDEVSPSV